MGKVIKALAGLNAYPIPAGTLEAIAMARGLELQAEFTDKIAKDRAYRLSMADTYMWLVGAPSVTQGGISYSFTAAEKKLLERKAAAIYAELEPESLDAYGLITYGYRGSSL